MTTGMKVLGLAGWSGVGKTTLLAKLIPELVGRGITVSSMKHAHHAFDVDTPGKDSYVHRAAGATEVMVASASRWALMHELRGVPEPSSVDLMKRMSPVDLLLIEGFKRESHDKMELYREGNDRQLLAVTDPHVVAILADGPVPELPRPLPVLDLNDTLAIADFVMRHCGFDPA